MAIRITSTRCLGALLLFCPAGCSTTYYAMWSKLGYEKRDILVSRVEKERDEQTTAKQTFQTTMDKFKAITNFNGGDLEAEYNKLDKSYKACQSEADAVNSKITSVDKVANDMFTEWQGELAQYSDEKLRSSSEQKLNESKQRYAKLFDAMKRSAASMDPVLAKFKDQVLYLKHNLNAAAIGSLQDTAAGIDSQVQDLIKQMNASIDEANSFIDNMKKS